MRVGSRARVSKPLEQCRRETYNWGGHVDFLVRLARMIQPDVVLPENSQLGPLIRVEKDVVKDSTTGRKVQKQTGRQNGALPGRDGSC